MPIRVGIVGFGHLGQYLVGEFSGMRHPDLELAFVWNRTIAPVRARVPDELILDNLDDFKERDADLIVEVCHPNISKQYGHIFLEEADFMVGSPTCMADPAVERSLRQACTNHGLYIPQGAFWGGEDIKKMADRGNLKALKVTMKKHPSSLKVYGELAPLILRAAERPVVLYDGSVRGLCPLAPNNVNTMAAAAIAAHNLGFDQVQGCLIADPSLTNYHVVEVEVWGPDQDPDRQFHAKTSRFSPAPVGEVTGTLTFDSFLSSMLAANGQGPGVHLC